MHDCPFSAASPSHDMSLTAAAGPLDSTKCRRDSGEVMGSSQGVKPKSWLLIFNEKPPPKCP